MDGIEHRQLTAQRTHGAIVLNIFHCKRPRFHIHSLFRLLRKSHYDYATELFFGFVGGGLAVSVFERQHKLDARCMIRKSGYRFSEKIMLKQKDRAR
jgi:hypothetical protein